MYELTIIGGGPAAIAAAVYAGRKRIKTALITKDFGGQSIVSDDIQNWIGDLGVSGFELAKRFEAHVRAQETVEVFQGEVVTQVESVGGEVPQGNFVVETGTGKKLETKTILVASGSKRRRLGVPGEDEFDGKGVVFCSTCDAPLFKDKDVAVVGGGNAGLEAVVDLIPYAKKITLLIRGEELKGDPITQEKVQSSAKVEVLFGAVTQEIKGDKMVQSLVYKDKKSDQTQEIAIGGVFIEIGAIPNSDFLGELIERNSQNEIIVDHKTQTTSKKGIWAAGDVTDVLYKQNNISAGDAVKGLLNIYDFLHKHTQTEAHK